MAVATICASHTPLMDRGIADEATRSNVDAAFLRLREFVGSFAPDLIIQFSPDHFNGFFYDLMPPFCLGVEATSVGDYGTQAGPLPVPAQLARELGDAIIAADVDIALSLRMSVDHGFVQIWEKMFGSADRFPLIPIFINCAAPPIPPYRRARLLGEAVGRWATSTGKRVLFAGSGGLSHDPPLPQVWDAPPEVRERLIAGRNPTPEARERHMERVLAAGELATRGEGPCLPLNRAWDEEVLAKFRTGRLAEFDEFNAEEVRAVGGRGGNEILTWIAALSAQSVAGHFDPKLEFYEPIDGWIAGMAMLTATSTTTKTL